jgi:hypothetical protein
MVGLGEVFETARRIDAPGHRVLRLEPELDLKERAEAAEEQAGADEEDAGERDFGDDEGIAHSGRGTTGRALMRGVPEAVTGVAP